MPAIVGVNFEDSKYDKTSIVLPGRVLRIFSADSKGNIEGGYVAIACDRDDESADVFSCREPIVETRDELYALNTEDCTAENLVRRLGHNATYEIQVEDKEAGTIKVDIEHMVTMSSN